MASEILELQWVKPARQERSRGTHERFVEAAQRLLGRGFAFHEISVAELAKEADSSIGAFYSRFRDKDALLRVLQAELEREGLATAADTFRIVADAPIALESLVRAFVALAVSSYRQQFGLRRALLVQMARDRDLRDHASALAHETCVGLVRVLVPRFPTAPLAQIELAVDVGHRIVYATLDQWLLFGDQSPTRRGLDDHALVGELTAAVVGYLKVSLGGLRDAS